MNITIHKNGQQIGPFTEEQVSGMLASGQLAPRDLAWTPGMSEWGPLSSFSTFKRTYLSTPPNLPMAFSQIERISQGGTPPVSNNSSGFALTSFIISLIGIGFWFMLLLLAGIGSQSGAQDDSPLMMGVGLLMLLGFGANIAGVVFGAIAIKKTISNRWMPVTGTILNSVEIIGIILLMIIGLSMG